MSHEMERIGHHWAGETLHLDFIVEDGDNPENDRKPLEGAEVQWWLSRRGDRVLDDSDDLVTTEIINPEQGEVQVRVKADATTPLAEKPHKERLQITDSNGRRSIFGAVLKPESPD